MKTFLLYIHQYSILTRSYRLYVYKVVTDNLYRVIGKIYCAAFEQIECIDYNLWTEAREQFWKDEGYDIVNYKEPKLLYED